MKASATLTIRGLDKMDNELIKTLAAEIYVKLFCDPVTLQTLFETYQRQGKFDEAVVIAIRAADDFYKVFESTKK